MTTGRRRSGAKSATIVGATGLRWIDPLPSIILLGIWLLAPVQSSAAESDATGGIKRPVEGSTASVVPGHGKLAGRRGRRVRERSERPEAKARRVLPADSPVASGSTAAAARSSVDPSITSISLQNRASSLGYGTNRRGTSVDQPPGTYSPGNGLSFLFNYTSESAGNPVGGIRHGSAYADQFLLGIDADLQHVAGIPDATLHFIGTQRDGKSLAVTSIGNILAPQEIYDGSENTRLTVLTYEQKLLNDRMIVEVGRLPAQGAFLVSPVYCVFQNVGTCGSPELPLNETNFTFFPTSTWGGHSTFFVTDKTYLHVGAFEAQPSAALPSDHGLDFGLHDATGVFIPAEVGYTSDRRDTEYADHYSIGGIIDRSGYSDPVLDVDGGRSLFSGLAPLQRFGRSLAFGRFDRTLYRSGASVLQVFGVAAGGTGGRQTQDYQLEFGAVLTAPFENRPYDTVGFVITDQHFTKLGLENVVAARNALGLNSTTPARSEALVEANYAIQIGSGIRITPNLQYIINPDNINEPFRIKATPNAFVVGGRLSIDFFSLAGDARGTGRY